MPKSVINNRKMQPDPDLMRGRAVQIGDVVSVSLRKELPAEKKEDGDEEKEKPTVIELFLIAEGQADDEVYLEPMEENTQVFRSLFRIEKAKPTPAEEAKTLRRDDARNAPKMQEEEEDKGKPVSYGGQISLRHLHSNKLLAFISEPKWQVQLSAFGPKARYVLTVQSADIHSSVGDIVKYQDTFSLVFREKNVSQFLTMKAGGLESVHLLGTSIAQTCDCIFNPYELYEPIPLVGLRYGSIITVSSKKLKMYMTGVKVKDNAGKPQLLTELKSVSTLKAADYYGEWKAQLTHSKDPDSFWIIEHLQKFTGGAIYKGDKFHLKHVSSEQYLGKDFKLYPSAPTNFYCSTPGFKKVDFNQPGGKKGESGGKKGDQDADGKKGDSNQSGARKVDPDPPLRSPDTVILLTSDDQGFQAEDQDTLEHRWQNMISSAQQGEETLGSQTPFGVNLIAVKQVDEAEENLFELAGVPVTEVDFYLSVLGFRSKIAEARTYLEGYQKLQSAGKYTLLRLTEYLKNLVFPNVTSALRTIVATLKASKTAEYLTKLQGILVNLKLHKEILTILAGLIMHNMDSAQEALLKECQNAMQMICFNNRHSCATMLGDSYTTMITILTNSPERFHVLLSTIMDVMELEHNTHQFFVDGMIEMLGKSLAATGIRNINSILKTLERMCKGKGARFDGYRRKVFEYLDLKGISNSLIIFEHEPDLFVTCIEDMGEQHYFSLLSTDLQDANFFDYLLDYLSLITIACEWESRTTGSCRVEKYIGLSFRDLIKLSNQPKVSFNLRSQLIRLLKVISIVNPTTQAEYELQLEKNCWLYHYEATPSYEDLAFTLFQDASQIVNPALARVEVLKRMELEFWVSETIPPSVASDLAKGSDHFLNYIIAHLEVVQDLLQRGYIQKFYLACIFQAISDALVGLVGLDATMGSDFPLSTHWTSSLFASLKSRMQAEGQRFKLQSAYGLFITILCQFIEKTKMRKVAEILMTCGQAKEGECANLARQIIERNWVLEDISRYIALNFDVDRLLGDDQLTERSAKYIRRLKDMKLDFVALLVEMMASKSPFLEDNSLMLKLVKSQNNQSSEIMDILKALEPMSNTFYTEISESVIKLLDLASSSALVDVKSEVNQRLLSLCGMMSNAMSTRVDTFAHLQVILRKMQVGQVLQIYWRLCYENRNSTDQDIRKIVSRLMALSKFYVANNPKNTRLFLRSMDWKLFFGDYSEFHDLMKAVGFATYLGSENLLHLIKSAVYFTDSELSTHILKFILVWLESDEDQAQLELLIANVLRQIIDELLSTQAPIQQEISDNIMFLAISILSESGQTRQIFDQTTSDVSARFDTGDESYAQLKDMLAGHLENARRMKTERLAGLVGYEAEDDVLDLHRHMSDQTDAKVGFLPKIRISFKFMNIKTSFHEKMHQAILEKFKRGIVAAQNPKSAKGKQFKTFIHACCSSFLFGPRTTFVFDLLNSLLEEVLILPANPSEAEKAVPDRVKVCFWEFGVIEHAFNAIVFDPNMLIKSSALQLLNTFVRNENYEFRERVVLFLKEADRFYPFFGKSVELMDKFKEDYAQMLKTRKKSQHTALSILSPKGNSAVSDTQLEVVQSVHTLTLFLQFYRAMSDVCFTSFQNLLRIQESYSGLTINMISHLTLFLSEATMLFGNSSSVADGSADSEAMPVLTETIEALSESVSGPNIENQTIVGANSRTYVAMHKIMSVVQVNQDEASQELHTACLNLFKALLETSDQPPDYFKRVMWKTLNSSSDQMTKHPRWETLSQGIKSIYEACVGVPENEKMAISGAPESLAKEQTLKIGILQCILLVRLEKIAGDKRLSEELQGNEPYISFYLRFIGYVEIAKVGTDPDHPSIFELYFPIPFEAKFLTLMTEGLLIENARRTSQQDKIDSFISKLGSCTQEMVHQQYISRFPKLKMLTQNWELCSTLSFMLVVIINIMLLCFTHGYKDGVLELDVEASTVVFYLALLQVALKGSAGVGFLVEYWPHVETIFRKKVEINITDYYRMSDKDSQYISTRYSSLLSGGADGAENLGGMMQASFYLYNYIYYVFMITAIFNYKLYPILLIDVVYQFTSLMTILKAITLNSKTLILTGFFAIVVIFIFTTVSFIYFQSYYDAEVNMFCDDLLHCFFSTVYFGIRAGGGIGDFLVQANPRDYWTRMIYDMFFYIVIIVIMLNIVFGIIIDTFGDLRDRKREAEEDINNVCFICGQDRNIIDLRGEGWMQHFMSIHSPFAYLSFLVYLQKLDVADCSGLEKYVKEMVASKDTGYFPSTSKMIGSQGAD